MTDYTGSSDAPGEVHPNQDLLIKEVAAFLSEVENLYVQPRG